MYPESVKIEFNENRDGNLQFLKIAYEIDTNPNTTYLVGLLKIYDLFIFDKSFKWLFIFVFSPVVRD